MIISLTEAKRENVCVITEVKDSEEKRRLLDLGFTPKSKIIVKKESPFGGALLVELRGVNIALQKNVTDGIFVEVKD